MSVAACRHCQDPKVSKPRGLCQTCYKNVSIRLLYSTLRSSRGHKDRAVYNRNCKYGVDPYGVSYSDDPTQAVPGSLEKVKVLEHRASKGLSLFHPRDLTLNQLWESQAQQRLQEYRERDGSRVDRRKELYG